MNIVSKLRPTALRLGDFFFFRQLLRLYYALAVFCCGLACRLSRGGAALFAHRGWTRGDWKPGASDLDLFLVMRGGGITASSSWAAKYGKLKKIFPMLGEWLAASEPELDIYLRHGDLRSAEFSATARKICGSADISPRYSPSPEKLRVDAWNECFHAHVRLCGLFFSGQEEPLVCHGARKSLLDIERYRSADINCVPPSRGEAEAALPQNSRLRVMLSGLSSCLPHESMLEALVHSTLLLEREAGAILTLLKPEKASLDADFIKACEHECEANDKFCADLRNFFGAPFKGAVTDTMFESYFVFSWEFAQEAAESLTDFRRLACEHPALAGSKIVLGPHSMHLLSAGLKMGDAAACGCGQEGDASAVGISGEGFFAHHRRAYFLEALSGGWNISSPHAAELRRGAFAKMLVSWRFDAFQGAPGECFGERLLYYWLPRAAHFYLFYVKDVELSCYPAVPILEELAVQVPHQSELLRRLIEGRLSRHELQSCAELVHELNCETALVLK